MFKVGDWVNVTLESERGKIQYPKPFLGKIVVIKDIEYQGKDIYCVHGQKDSDWIEEIDIELWQPKEGEWCWCWNEINDIPALRKFVKVNGFMLETKCGYFKQCEPFIGELPNILKDL